MTTKTVTTPKRIIQETAGILILVLAMPAALVGFIATTCFAGYRAGADAVRNFGTWLRPEDEDPEYEDLEYEDRPENLEDPEGLEGRPEGWSFGH